MAAFEITSVFNFVMPSPLVPFPTSSSTFIIVVPSLPSSSFFAKGNEHVVYCMESNCPFQLDADIDIAIRSRSQRGRMKIKACTVLLKIILINFFAF